MYMQIVKDFETPLVISLSPFPTPSHTLSALLLRLHNRWVQVKLGMVTTPGQKQRIQHFSEFG